MTVPVIETERLRLRGHGLDDFAATAAMWAAPAVVQHITGRPSTGEESWARLLRYAGHWALLGFGYWAIEETASGQFVGEAGFSEYRRDIESALKDAPEIGWVLAPWAHGRGFATEAVRAIVAWGERNLPGRHTWCVVAPEHRASIRVAEKCGYREIERTTYEGQPAVVFAR